MPVGIVKRLPRAITRADPETLSFLSPDRYPTGPAKRLAEQHGLAQPDITLALTRWSDYLVANRMGQGPVTPAPKMTGRSALTPRPLR